MSVRNIVVGYFVNMLCENIIPITVSI